MTHYDLAIIGSGSGNTLLTPEYEGKRTAFIEQNPVYGGTCLNVGCIPTKMFVYAADVARTVEEAAKYGIDARLDGVRWRDIRDRVFGRIDPISDGGASYRRDADDTDLYVGQARFVGQTELEVHGADGVQKVTADTIVVATGSTPRIPEALAESGVEVHTNETIMRIDELPAHMTIVGGGFIAAEFAHVFDALGVDVTIVTRGACMLSRVDETIQQAFAEIAREQWDVRTNAQVEHATQGERITLTLTNGDEIETDLVLVAAGRAPVAPPGAREAGIELHDDGRIEVDEFGRTTVGGVWSLGDASSPYQLKHVANQEARCVSHNILHPDDLRAFDHRYVPAAIFTHPQIAHVGLTEAQARSTGRPLTVKVQKFGDTAYGWAMEDTTDLFKILADRETGEILGCHVMGPDASTLIQPIVQAMSFEQSAIGLAREQYWIHPAMSEVVENALLGLEFD